MARALWSGSWLQELAHLRGALAHARIAMLESRRELRHDRLVAELLERIEGGQHDAWVGIAERLGPGEREALLAGYRDAEQFSS